jgi:RNA polymerase sigma factor (sigma-70 family)
VSSVATKKAKIEAAAQWSDGQLVEHCMKGSEEAWAALLAKYKNLIYSIPIKLQFSQDDAADIFQAVCTELISQMGSIRNPDALGGWLIKVTTHRCWQWKRQSGRFVDYESAPEPAAASESLPEHLLAEVQNEQMLRTALRELSDRCRKLVEMLFFETPARPYDEVAREFGIASGSVGFIRGRCLEKLRRRLVQMGFY